VTNDELRGLARAARASWGSNDFWYESTVEDVDAVDAAYITAASPERILALLAEINNLAREYHDECGYSCWETDVNAGRICAYCCRAAGYSEVAALQKQVERLRADVARLRAAVEMAIDYAGNPSDTNECTISAPAFEEKWGLVGDLSDMRLVARWRSALDSVKDGDA